MQRPSLGDIASLKRKQKRISQRVSQRVFREFKRYKKILKVLEGFMKLSMMFHEFSEDSGGFRTVSKKFRRTSRGFRGVKAF